MGRKKGSKHKKVTPPEASPVGFSITLQVGATTYTSNGLSVANALRSLERPQKIVTKGFLTLNGNGKQFKRMFMPSELKRFLWPVSNDIQAKIIAVGLK